MAEIENSNFNERKKTPLSHYKFNILRKLQISDKLIKHAPYLKKKFILEVSCFP